MAALIGESLKGLRVQILDLEQVASEGSVPYDPQTNGAAEVAVKLAKASLRANFLTLESRLKAKIPPHHAILTWLIRHSAMLRTIRQVGRDGKTAYGRTRGSACSSKILGFAENARYKCRAQERTVAGIVQSWRFEFGVYQCSCVFAGHACQSCAADISGCRSGHVMRRRVSID